MTDLDRLNAALNQEPWLTLSALADAHEERGEAALAAGYRWLAATERAPRHCGHGLYVWERWQPPAHWPRRSRATREVLTRHLYPWWLPLAVKEARGLRCKAGGLRVSRYFRPRHAAYRAAAEVVGRLLVG